MREMKEIEAEGDIYGAECSPGCEAFKNWNQNATRSSERVSLEGGEKREKEEREEEEGCKKQETRLAMGSPFKGVSQTMRRGRTGEEARYD